MHAACRQHPWFTLHLPRYLAVMHADTLASAAMIDDDTLAEVVRLGFRRAEVLDAIQKRVQNKARGGRAAAPCIGFLVMTQLFPPKSLAPAMGVAPLEMSPLPVCILVEQGIVRRPEALSCAAAICAGR